MRSARSVPTLVIASTVAIGLLAGCGSPEADATDSQDPAAEDEPVTLSVVSLIPGSEQEAFDAFDARVAEFEAMYPNIDVEGVEYEWRATTFAAQLAGGTLPDVYEIPLTDAKALIENGQLADIDAQVAELTYAEDFNTTLLETGMGEDGKVYALPAKSIYGVALHYNRAMFEAAGLDPDNPPTTWDEVREYAAAIKEATGQAGYATMAASNTGGWQLTSAIYSRGGRVQEENSDGTFTATLDSDEARETLQFLHDLRWEDDSILADTTLDWSTINQAYAAGQTAMYTSGSDVFTSLVETNGVTGDDYGLTAMPVEGSDGAVLIGGTLAAVNVNADEATKDAAVKWMDFFYLNLLLDEQAAIAEAEVRNANNQAVGTPVLPIFSREQYEARLGWIADFVNVPLDQMVGYTDVMFDQPVYGQPSRSTQEFYGLLDTAIQAVLTDENVDIDALLGDLNDQAQTLLDAS